MRWRAVLLGENAWSHKAPKDVQEPSQKEPCSMLERKMILSSGAGTAGFWGESWSLFAINIPIHPCFCCKNPHLDICWYDCRLCLSTLHSSLLNPHFFATRPILCGSMMTSPLLVGEIAVFFGWIPWKIPSFCWCGQPPSFWWSKHLFLRVE